MADKIPPLPGTSALPGAKRTAPKVVSQNIANNTELTLMMPVKPGFVPVRDTITYATRARLLMNAFNNFRRISREASDLHPFADVVERIETIQSYRLNLLENDTRLMLAVSFDQPWEPYIRHIWRDTGPFLDAILCNCVDYEKHASTQGFDAFAQWVRKTQVTTDFFYIADNLSVEDRAYLHMQERRQREGRNRDPQRDIDIARLYLPDIEQKARLERAREPAESINIGLRALGVLYRLNDFYPKDGSEDHLFYHYAVRRLLDGFDPSPINDRTKALFAPELAWWHQEIKTPPKPRVRKAPKDGTIQGGIVRQYPGVTHGALLLLRIRDRAAACQFIRSIKISGNQSRHKVGPVQYNIAFTYNGLVQLQVDPDELDRFPQEFKEGMESRGGMLGDTLLNHPSNWRPPTRWLPDGSADGETEHVNLHAVDFAIQLRVASEQAYHTEWTPEHPLYAAVGALLRSTSAQTGVQLLALQPMGHQRDKRSRNHIREHFGFIDGVSQPKLNENINHVDNPEYTNDAALGDVLLGYPNSFADPGYNTEQRRSILDSGSFLVIRKLRQDVDAFKDLLPRNRSEANRTAAKMMGRGRNGKPLARLKHRDRINEFDFARDADGDTTPLHSHIRRANPREIKPVIGRDRGRYIRTPRIVRRGMSYGPKYTLATREADRGLMFMAYNSSIAEQFEIIQRWLNGANSSNGFSGQSDPFMGIAKRGERRTFRYVDRGKVERLNLDNPDQPRQIVELQWGMYLFAPSLKALRKIAAPNGRRGLVARGEKIIAELRRIENEQTQLDPDLTPVEKPIAAHWKTVMEDLQQVTQENTDAVWAAVRAKHKGVLRTPYGVLLANPRLAREVLSDDGSRFSVRRYWWRLGQSFGDIYLSMDPKPKKFPGGDDPSQPPGECPYHKQVERGEYERKSQPVNDLVNSFDQAFAFGPSYTIAQGVIAGILANADGVQGNMRLRFLVDQVLGHVCQMWFGFPDGKEVQLAGEPLVTKPNTLHCPYHFVSSSRYAFSPLPTPAAAAEGRDHGSRLHAAALRWIKAMAQRPERYETPIGGELFRQLEHDPDRLAAELIGVMHGFLPTTLGNLLRTLEMWAEDGNLWRIQEDMRLSAQSNPLLRAHETLLEPLQRAMQYRPVPEYLHRFVVARNARLGDVRLHPGDRVVVGVGSVSADLAERGKVEADWVFGGKYSGRYASIHACPGRDIAYGVMLGVLSALFEVPNLKNEPAPLILTISS